jgi:hypothetical protein
MDQVKAALNNLIYVLGMVVKTIDNFEVTMINDVHALYNRVMSHRSFIVDMTGIITRQLTEAWNKGADEVMVLPEDYTDDDKAVLQGIIDSEVTFLDGLANDIEQAKADGKGWQQFQPRVDIWTNRYNDVQNQAKVYFGGKFKLIWHLGATEQHCKSCSALNGIVAWAQEWDEAGVKPQNPPNDSISCGGWKCDCSLDSTTERRTNKALDKIMAIAAQAG